jgi:hypothetical protein
MNAYPLLSPALLAQFSYPFRHLWPKTQILALQKWQKDWPLRPVSSGMANCLDFEKLILTHIESALEIIVHLRKN